MIAYILNCTNGAKLSTLFIFSINYFPRNCFIIIEITRQVALQIKSNRNESSPTTQWNKHFRDICAFFTFDLIVNILEINTASIKFDTYLSSFKRIQNSRHTCFSKVCDLGIFVPCNDSNFLQEGSFNYCRMKYMIFEQPCE